MKSTSKLLTILSLSLGLIGASAFGINAQAKSKLSNQRSRIYQKDPGLPATQGSSNLLCQQHANLTQRDVHKRVNACQESR